MSAWIVSVAPWDWDAINDADSETVSGTVPFVAEVLFCNPPAIKAMAFRAQLVPASFFLLITPGAAGLQVSDAPPTTALPDTVETALLSDAEAQAPGALLPADSTEAGVCVLAGDATDEHRCEYCLCLEGALL